MSASLTSDVFHDVTWWSEPRGGARSEDDLIHHLNGLCGACADNLRGMQGFDADPWTVEEVGEYAGGELLCEGCNRTCNGVVL